MSLACPRCRVDLIAEATGGSRTDRCASCNGVAVAVAHLRRFAPRDRLRSVWINLPEGSAGGPCPSCSNAMRQTRVTAGTEAVALDVCKRCQLLWFDATELAQFSPERQAPPPRADRLSPDAAEALFLAEQEGTETLDRAEEQASAISAAACAGFSPGVFAVLLLKRLVERRS